MWEVIASHTFFMIWLFKGNLRLQDSTFVLEFSKSDFALTETDGNMPFKVDGNKLNVW